MSAAILLFPLLIVAGVWLGHRVASKAAHETLKMPPLPVLPKAEAIKETWNFEGKDIQVVFYPPSKEPKKNSGSITLLFQGTFSSALFLSKELKGDLLLKTLGLSQETEIGASALDRRFHIVGQDYELTKRLLSESATEEILLQLADNLGFEFLEIRDRGCRIFFTPYLNLSQRPDRQFLEETAAKFAKVCVAAEKIFGTSPNPATEKFARRFNLYESRTPSFILMLGLFAYVFISYTIELYHGSQPLFPLDGFAIFGICGLATASAGFLLASSLLRSLQLPSKVFFQILNVIACWSVLIFSLGGSFLNIYWDKEEGDKIELSVLHKNYYHSRKSGDHYSVDLEKPVDPLLPIFDDFRWNVSESTFRTIKPHVTKAETVIHGGYFHFP